MLESIILSLGDQETTLALYLWSISQSFTQLYTSNQNQQWINLSESFIYFIVRQKKSIRKQE